MKYNIPNLFLIGAPKAGTSALAEGLQQHSRIFMPYKKEPKYFDARTFYDFEEDYPIKSIDHYLNLYSTNQSSSILYRLDASVFNMYSLESIKDILLLSPKSKFILMLREPLSASKSMQKQRLKYTREGMRELSEDFCECWEYLKGRSNGTCYPKKCRNKFLFRYDLLYSYERYVPYIIDFVGRNNIFIGKYENFKKDPSTFYKRLFNFLSLDGNSSVKNKLVNKSYILKNCYMNRIITCSALATSDFRRKIGLSGQRVNFIKKNILRKNDIEKHLNTDCDAEVKAFFSRTYTYLSELEFDS
ncbi:hypothetical protein DO021_10790 [Desulfobacter hydrogenophilus]|uniref:Sulfotransferase domain-containing protein n=1 Tax=Desulfobacter hydrogenophilus TaxID=2291 RepID=A0A328FB67_9BACT|nr:sulfotransferase domain-containing protein [Desulfobacter hydrogenophilus]NDY72000.1 sulfotransferase domain-containing protein [Desulfobacter hydrogenophilus]QBH15448.1 hypothetical protein EYB58_22635 [Desulfobacter hydrogenophilus]RAM01924.1 hypothetical protein DO021_10790 [Desulfobacter hydrogenophilus]